MMQKQKGFTLLELIVVIALIGIISSTAAPSFSRWRAQQNFDTDSQQVLSLLGDVRASALADKNCGAVSAIRWIAQIDGTGTSVLCEPEGGGGAETISTTPWKSDSVISVGKKTSLSDATWNSLQTISIFPGGTQSRIGTEYTHKWARIHLNSLDAGKENTICFSRIANYPFLSPLDTCLDN